MKKITQAEAMDALASIQGVLYLDTRDGLESWNKDKEWDAAAIEEVARVMRRIAKPGAPLAPHQERKGNPKCSRS